MLTIPLLSYPPPLKLQYSTTFKPILLLRSGNFSPNLNSSISRKKKCLGLYPKLKGSNGIDSLRVVACSTTSSPLIGGKVGWHRREGNSSLLYFGTCPDDGVVEVQKQTDSSQVLSAMLPFVVALTAVAALSQPSTFSW